MSSHMLDLLDPSRFREFRGDLVPARMQQIEQVSYSNFLFFKSITFLREIACRAGPAGGGGAAEEEEGGVRGQDGRAEGQGEGHGEEEEGVGGEEEEDGRWVSTHRRHISTLEY